MAARRWHQPGSHPISPPCCSATLHAQTLDILALCPDPQACDRRTRVPTGTVPASGRRALLHGDGVPGNMVRSGPDLTLIDWQCPAIGDPVHDLGVFPSPAMQLICRGAPLSRSEQSQFLEA